MSTYHPNTAATPTPSVKDRAYATVETLRAKIDEGLDGLPDEAKARVRAAREAAIAAQSDIQERARAAAQQARQTAHDNPLLIGALAFAAGAAIAAALPRTSTENRVVGAHRDRLFDEAERLFHEETAKLKATAEDVVAKGQEKAKAAVRGATDQASASLEAIGSNGAKKQPAAQRAAS